MNTSNVSSKLSKKVLKSSSKKSTNITTLSGLDIRTSKVIIRSISAIIGVIIFVGVPIIANNINKPITSVILNIIPNDLILAYFIVEDNIDEYLFGCIFSPLINVIDNIISYILYYYVKTTASFALWSNILIWIFAIIMSYIFI
jgi:hypothetical protein